MSDILDSLEQSAIADTLIAPLHSAYEQEVEHEYDETSEQAGDSQADGEDFAQEQPEEGELPEITPEVQQAWMQQNADFEALPEAEQFEQCSQSLGQQYMEAAQSITPEEAQEFVASVCAEHGFAGLESRIPAQDFAVVAEVGSSNFEAALLHHPAADGFIEAARQYHELTPEQQQSPKGMQAYRAAVGAAMPLNSRAASLAFLNDLGTLLGLDLVHSGDPRQLCSQLAVDFAQKAGWLSLGLAQQQDGGRGLGSASPFRTNSDLFDSEAMEEVARRGLS